MPGKKLLRTASRIEDVFDKALFAIRKRLNRIEPLVILPYRGFGNRQSVKIMGRVLEDIGLEKPSDEDTTWENIVAMFRRYTSYEIPFVRLSAMFQGQTQEIRTDEEGYFQVTFPVNAAQLDTQTLWHPVTFQLLDIIVEGQEQVMATGEVMIPDDKSAFGIISDIDDTVLVSETTRLLEVVRLSLAENAVSRLPFHGIAAFYEALQKGRSGAAHNPFFFVSSSPWNLYDVLTDFFEINGIPKAPVLLRDLGLSETKFIKEKHSEHKPAKIRHILDTYPNLPFILVGDNGQHDPQIYSQIIREYPGRILAAYIRDVTPDAQELEIKKITEEVLSHGVDMVLCADTEAASQHALAKGFIQAERMDDIHRETKKDEQT